MGGVVIANYFIVWKQELPDVAKASFPPIILLSFVAFAAGIASKYILHFGFTTINALVVSFVLEAAFGYMVLNKQAGQIKAQAGMTESETE